MIAYREWRLRILVRDMRPVLQSTYTPTVWLEPTLTADRLPEVYWARELDADEGGDVLPSVAGEEWEWEWEELPVAVRRTADGGRTTVTTAPPPMGMGPSGAVHGMYPYSELHGIHAVLPGATAPFLSRVLLSQLRSIVVIGAVDCYGRVVEHTDGVVRAEHARVLAVRVVWPNARCPDRCPVYWVVRTNRSYWDRSDPPPGPIADVYVLRKPCAERWGCRGEVTDPGMMDAIGRQLGWTGVVARATSHELERLLRERYEIPELPHGEGPWKWG